MVPDTWKENYAKGMYGLELYTRSSPIRGIKRLFGKKSKPRPFDEKAKKVADYFDKALTEKRIADKTLVRWGPSGNYMEPYDPYQKLGSLYYYTGQYDLALENYKKSILQAKNLNYRELAVDKDGEVRRNKKGRPLDETIRFAEKRMCKIAKKMDPPASCWSLIKVTPPNDSWIPSHPEPKCRVLKVEELAHKKKPISQKKLRRFGKTCKVILVSCKDSDGNETPGYLPNSSLGESITVDFGGTANNNTFEDRYTYRPSQTVPLTSLFANLPTGYVAPREKVKPTDQQLQSMSNFFKTQLSHDDALGFPKDTQFAFKGFVLKGHTRLYRKTKNRSEVCARIDKYKAPPKLLRTPRRVYDGVSFVDNQHGQKVKTTAPTGRSR